MRLAFLGTPAAAVPPLRALVEAGHEVALVVTRADARRGRGEEPTPSPVKTAAAELGLPVTTTVDDVLGAGVDLGVVVAFGRLIRPHVLAAVPMVNVHFSLLPRWRGAAPVERAILAGDAETGVCLMEVVDELDAGGIYACESTPIGPDDTAESLRERLVAIATRLLVERLTTLGPAVPQEGEVTHAAKITPEDLRLDWRRSAVELARLPRVGKAWTTFRGKRLLVRRARPIEAAGVREPAVLDGARVGTGEGWLELIEVEPEGRRSMAADAWLRGARPAPGECLGT